MSKQKMFGVTPEFKILPDGSNYTGSFGEITIDLALPGLRIHDGSCCGGIINVVGVLSECSQKQQDAMTKAAEAADAKNREAAAATKTLAVKKVEV